ncbi:hypothetical protein C0991_009719 [Blastosporella zonata]|nr:hypothetical protein C0991_009719 [Blastosporella zonata]
MDLYNNDRLVRHTLTHFIDHARQLFDPETTNDHIRFVLTREYDEGDRTYQAVIEPIQGHMQEHDELSIMRDYNSAIGISEIFMVTGNIWAFTAPHPSLALKSGLHFKYNVTHGKDDIEVEFHKIPNFEFAKFGGRHHLHIFFPRLWDAGRSESSKPYLLHDRERAIWYERGMRPAIASLLGHHVASEWPATLEAEEIRARQAPGGLAWGRKTIPKEILDEESARYQLKKFLHDAHLTRDIITTGDWYIDVAIEIVGEQGDCLQWLTSTHNEVVRQDEVVRQALRIEPETAQKITSLTSSKYARDLASHLTAISGFRIVPGALASGPFQAKYIQAYTTDKAAADHAKFLTTKNALATDQPASQISDVFTLFEAARSNNTPNARLKMRVPLEFATRALLEFDVPLLKGCMGVFPRHEWWTFKITRLLAASQAISNQASGRAELRVYPQALALTAACVWLINGLHARPEDGPASQRLMDVALPLTEDNGASLDTVAYRSAGPRVGELLYAEGTIGAVAQGFLEEEEQSNGEGEGGEEINALRRRRPATHLRLGEVPRLRIGGPVLIPAAFKFWFGVTIEVLEWQLVKTGFVDKELVRAIRSTTNKSAIALYHNWNPEPEPDMFAIGRPGQLVPPPIFDDGSDVEDAGTHPPPAQTLNRFTSELWRQFCVDVLSKPPNPQGNTNASYLKIGTVARGLGGEQAFKNFVLSEAFRCVSYKFAHKADWRRAFKWLFPPKGYEVSSSVQNYPSCPYFTRWMKFVNKKENSNQTVEEVRMALWNRLFSWSWIPDAQQDKMWPTTSTGNVDFTRVPPSFKADGKPNPAPRILIHPDAPFRFNEPANG